MKHHNSSSLFWRLFPTGAFLLAALFLIHSCKKDNKTAAIADPVINQAKEWYEATYSTPIVRAAVPVNRSSGAASNTLFDYTQYIKPDWQHAASYTRYKAGVIELPLDPSSDKISSGFKNVPGKTLYPHQYSRSSFLLLKQGGQYQAYVMTIIGDSAYINNNPAKLSLTTYRKRDPDFSGVVAYFTPNGKFVASYGFKNGKLIIPPGTASAPASTAATSTKSLTRFHSTTREAALNDCVDWYLDTYVNDELVSSEYLYTTCSGGDTGGDGGGSSPPPTCPSGSGDTSSPPPAEFTQHSTITRVAQPSPTPVGDDGGLPPPTTTQTDQSCPVTPPPLDTTNDPCAQAKAAAANQAFISRMDSLQSLRNTPGETTYVMMSDGTFKKQTSNLNGGTDLNFPIGYFNGSKGFLHNHGAGVGMLSVFTAADISSLYTIVSQGNVADSYVYSLVNSSGQSYLLAISNMSNFTSWASSVTTNGNPSAAFLGIFNVLINSGNSDLANENALITLLRSTNSGLTLMKGNAANTNWSQLIQNSDGSFSIVQCN